MRNGLDIGNNFLFLFFLREDMVNIGFGFVVSFPPMTSTLDFKDHFICEIARFRQGSISYLILVQFLFFFVRII